MGPKDAWESVIQPCITTRWSKKKAIQFGAKAPGRALIIGTPKGFNYFADMLNFRESDPEWNTHHYDYKDSPLLDQAEIEAKRHSMDPITFASEYEALIKESGSSVFYCFDRKLHVDMNLPEIEENEDVHVCIDFNVLIQASSIFTLRGGQMHFLDELKGSPNTEALAIILKTRYVDKGHKVYAYPDPSGNSAKTSAPVGTTDFSILRSHGIEIRARRKAPPIINSVNAVNRMLLTAAGETRMFFHPRCKRLIESMEQTKWLDNNPDTASIDKKEGKEHFSDGVRYGSEYLFPIRTGKSVTSQGFTF